jgi:hypothetical protein
VVQTSPLDAARTSAVFDSLPRARRLSVLRLIASEISTSMPTHDNGLLCVVREAVGEANAVRAMLEVEALCSAVRWFAALSERYAECVVEYNTLQRLAGSDALDILPEYHFDLPVPAFVQGVCKTLLRIPRLRVQVDAEDSAQARTTSAVAIGAERGPAQQAQAPGGKRPTP